MSIALILTVAAAIFVIAIMDARTRRLAFRIEHLHQMRSDDTSARLALNEKVNQLVDELRAYVVSLFDEGSEFYALQTEVANMWDTLTGFKQDCHADQDRDDITVAAMNDDLADLKDRLSRVESDAKWRYSDFDVDGRMRLLSPYEIVVSLQSKLEELAARVRRVESDGPLDLPVPTDHPAEIVPQDMIDKAWESEASDDGAPENLTEQRITAMERAYDTTASQVALSELERKVKALRTEILGGPLGDSGIPTPGALSELRQQVEGINTNLGHKVERATKLNKAAIQLVAQSAARTEVRTILRKRKGFWRTTLGNMWGWLFSPIK